MSETVRRALRFVAALIGGFVALYLFFLLAASSVLNAVDSITPVAVEPWYYQLIAVGLAVFGASRYAILYERGRGSLEQLWTFVIAVHLLTYAVLFPYFHVIHAREGFHALLSTPASSVAYYGVGHGLLLLAIVGAYVLVYGDAVGVAKRRFAA